MKKLLLLTLFPLALFAQSFLISNIPLPKTYIQNLDPYECDEECMQEYLEKDMIFSFLAHAKGKLEDPALDEERMMHISILNLGSMLMDGDLKIALLLPYKIIGRYAPSTTNASFAYLISKNHEFELKSYKLQKESPEEIEQTLEQIRKDGFAYVIAPLTQRGATLVRDLDPELNIYFPTINKKDVNSSSPYLYFGGIDYRAQSDLLLEEAVSPLVIFYDKSSIGKKLAQYEEEKFKFVEVQDTNFSNPEEFGAHVEETTTMELEERNVVKFSIPRRTTNLEAQLKENEDIIDGSFFINTPIIKTSMIMSQLTLYETNATNVLSTQINYDPLLLTMTQYQDRKEMLIANSITEHNNILVEANALLGNDIVYDWINYTTTVGVDYFFNRATGEKRVYDIPIQENQMIYPIELLKPSKSRFYIHKQVSEEG